MASHKEDPEHRNGASQNVYTLDQSIRSGGEILFAQSLSPKEKDTYMSWRLIGWTHIRLNFNA